MYIQRDFGVIQIKKKDRKIKYIRYKRMNQFVKKISVCEIIIVLKREIIIYDLLVKFIYDCLFFVIFVLVILYYWLYNCYIIENLELIEAGKVGFVGLLNELFFLKQLIRDQKTVYLTIDVNILENGIGFEYEFLDINFQVRD